MADDLIAEEWRPIEGWPGYEVSDIGRVRKTVSYQFIVKPTVAHNGYLRVSLFSKEKKQKIMVVSRLVCSAFNGPRPSLAHVAAHNDGNRQHNVPDNLRWATQAENMQDKVKHDTHQRGARNPNARLNEDQVREIRLLYSKGKRNRASLARSFGVEGKTIWRVGTGRDWRYLKD